MKNHIFSRIINYKLNDFYKSTVSLSLTSFLSQLIVFVGTPLITRIYSPEDFADVSILSALIQCLGVFATLRYDNAIPLCDSEEEADSLFIICSIFNIVFSISIFFLLLLMRKIDFNFFTLKNQNYILFVPIGVSLYGFVNLLSFYSTRTHEFKKIGVSRVLQSFTSIFANISIAYTSKPLLGPIIAYLFQIGFGVVYMSNHIFLKLKLLKSNKHNFTSLMFVAAKFKNFPKFSLVEALMQMVSIQLPFFYLNYINSESESGYLMNALKFSQIPIVLISSSISQVYYGHIKNNLDKGTLYPIAKDILSKLFRLVVMPLIILLPFYPLIFQTYLGVHWVRSGELLQWIIPYIISYIFFSIFSVNFYANNRFKESFFVQVVIFVVRLLTLVVGHQYFPIISLEIFFISSAIIYIIFTGYALSIINISLKDILKSNLRK